MTANRSRLRRIFSRTTLCLFALTGLTQTESRAATPEAARPADAPLTFELDVRPILKAYCLDCHGGEEKPEGGLDLRLKRFMLTGGDSGPAIAAGAPNDSLLMQRMRSGEMPPGEKKVPTEQLQIIERWIASGANTAKDEPLTLDPGIGITAEEREYWAFQPVKRQNPPKVKEAKRVRTPVDAFVLAKLESVGLTLNTEADKLTLLKRAYFDLLGLPPSVEETQAFLNDKSANAYEAMIDRLLASPHYGERWGRHWLDVAGYADSDGDGNVDTVRPYMYKYRDYVIRSLNADKPLDQFLIEQIAGDELVPQPYKNLSPDAIEKLTATGFLRMAADPTVTNQGDQDLARNTVVADTLKIVSSSLLGLSVGCAQCHDHRYDPIPQADYYRLRAVFEPGLNVKAWFQSTGRLVSLYTDADRAKAAEVDAEAAKLQAVYNEKRDKMVDAAFEKALEKFPEGEREKFRAAFKAPADKRTDEQKQLVASNPGLNVNPGVLYQFNQAAADELAKDAAEIAKKRAEKPVEEFLSALTEPANHEPPVTSIFHRGDHRSPTKPVKPGDLTIAAPAGERLDIAEDDGSLPTSGRRLAWAKHITNGKHPLVGRVLANRIWLLHFGRGIVDTPGELGILGTRPTHPELLDWLADELVQQGWSLKKMHKLIMTSSVYRQSSVRNSSAAGSIDTDGSLYSRYSVRRLDAESVRDRMLATTGRLDAQQFGPPVDVMEDFAGQVHVKDDSARRSVYVQVRRSKPVSLLTAFDAPVMAVNCDRRTISTVAPQSLMLMNGDFTLKQAEHLARRLQNEASEGPDKELVKEFGGDKVVGEQSAWRYGYGYVDLRGKSKSAADAAVRFKPFKNFTGTTWQAEKALPNPTAGWASLTAQGGHPGDPKHGVIRRWTSNKTRKVVVQGILQHPSENGDGVRAGVISNRAGLLGEWSAKTNKVDTTAGPFDVQAGEVLDFIVGCGANETSDSFSWSFKVIAVNDQGAEVEAWDSAGDFRGPSPGNIAEQVAYAWRLAYCRPITREEMELACKFVSQQVETLKSSGAKGDHQLIALQSLCQQIMSSNEFLYLE